MSEVRKRIVRMAKILSAAATVAKVVTIVLMVVTCLQIAAAFSIKVPAIASIFDGHTSLS